MRRVALFPLIVLLPLFVLVSCQESPQGISDAGGLQLAGNPHFVGGVSITRTNNSLTVSGKVAGLGNEEQIRVEISADAQCVNPGQKKPKAANKQSFNTSGEFPVQNGKAEFSLDLTATFQPSCTGPMTIEFSNVKIEVFDNGNLLLSRSFGGTF